MFVINILGFLSGNYLLARKSRYSYSRALPLSTTIMIGVLYILAVVNHLNVIDYLSIIVCVVTILICIRDSKVNIQYILEAIFFLLICLLIVFFSKDHLTTSSDEKAYWSLETKTLYLLNGFSEKGREPAYRFGDYHPGLCLFMWWFCHFSTCGFSEGLLYAGYWILFSIPTIGVIAEGITIKKTPLRGVFTIVIIFCLPSIVNRINYECITPELPMASCFALLIFHMFSQQKYKNDIYYTTLLCLLMVLLKLPGILWILGAVILGYSKQRDKRILLYPVVSCVGFSLIWKVYCILMNRSSYLSTGFYQTLPVEIRLLGKKHFASSFIGYFKSYCLTFIKEPLHQSNDAIINLTALSFCLLFAVLIWILIKQKIVSQKDGVLLFKSYSIIQLCMLITIPLICTFVFKEIQYYETNKMVFILSRYGANLFISPLLLIVFLVVNNMDSFNKTKQVAMMACLCSFILICCDFHSIYQSLFSLEKSKTELQSRLLEKERYAHFFNEKERILCIKKYDNYKSSIDNLIFLGNPQNIIFKESSSDNLFEDIEKYKDIFKVNKVYLVGFDRNWIKEQNINGIYLK